MARFNCLTVCIFALPLLRIVASFSTNLQALYSSKCERSVLKSSRCQSSGGDDLQIGNGILTRWDGIYIGRLTTSAVLVASIMFGSLPVSADEYGRETEAPTLFTGEGVMICTKRGPLGACLETATRTSENDNDKSNSYFKAATESQQRKYSEDLDAENEASALIQKLRQQSSDNREKNDLLVQQKTFMNDQSASFGPFDRQVLILNEDGKGFTLLANPQAMKLKEAGFIKDKRFIKQPTPEEIENALSADEPGFLDSIFGGK